MISIKEYVIMSVISLIFFALGMVLGALWEGHSIQWEIHHVEK